MVADADGIPDGEDAADVDAAPGAIPVAAEVGIGAAIEGAAIPAVVSLAAALAGSSATSELFPHAARPRVEAASKLTTMVFRIRFNPVIGAAAGLAVQGVEFEVDGSSHGCLHSLCRHTSYTFP